MYADDPLLPQPVLSLPNTAIGADPFVGIADGFNHMQNENELKV
jgi:hypothetical protein